MLALSYIFYIQKHNSNSITGKCSSLVKFRLLVGNFPVSTAPLRARQAYRPVFPVRNHYLSTLSLIGLDLDHRDGCLSSPILKFLCGRIHLFLACNCCRYSLLHLDQNSCARCCVRLHLFLQYRSSLLNSPRGGSTSLVFPVSSILGDNGGAESGSLRVSTVRGLLLIVYSASQRKVLNDSSSRRLPCSLMRPFMTLLIDLIVFPRHHQSC